MGLKRPPFSRPHPRMTTSTNPTRRGRRPRAKPHERFPEPRSTDLGCPSTLRVHEPCGSQEPGYPTHVVPSPTEIRRCDQESERFAPESLRTLIDRQNIRPPECS